jgi:hypothetical protein
MGVVSYSKERGVWGQNASIKLKRVVREREGIPRTMSRIMMRFKQRIQIEYDRRNGYCPALLEIDWDTVQHCPVLIEDGYVVSMNTSENITLRNVLLLNHIYVDHIEGMVLGQPFDEALLDRTIKNMPLCQLKIQAPVLPTVLPTVYEPSMEAVMEEILEEIESIRSTE